MNNPMPRIVVLLFAAQLLLLAGCGKGFNIPGNVAGQVMTQAGVGRGLMTVALFDQDTNQEVQRVTSDDGGGYFLEKVPPGKYYLKVVAIGDLEYKTDAEPFTLGPGKTETINITIFGKAGEGGDGSGEAGGAMDGAAGGMGGE